MIAIHSLSLTCRCPENGRLDSYEIVVETGELLMVEEIERTAAEFLGQRVYQERLAEELAKMLGAKVTVTGHHGAVRTVVVAAQPEGKS